VEYASPFWRENNYSGTLFSQASIIQEINDHSTADYKGYALKGFLNGGTHTLSEEERKAKVILQLTKLFGEAANYVEYNEKSMATNHLPFPLRAPTHGTCERGARKTPTKKKKKKFKKKKKPKSVYVFHKAPTFVLIGFVNGVNSISGQLPSSRHVAHFDFA
jgi:hypothetical protein